MKLSNRRQFVLFLGVLFTALFSSIQISHAGEIPFRERLIARFSGVRAAAKFESRDARMKFTFEIQNATPGAVGTVSVGTGFVNTFVVDALGRAKVDLDTTDGDFVPNMANGDVVRLEINGVQYNAILRRR
jgi:hypothetical protein